MNWPGHVKVGHQRAAAQASPELAPADVRPARQPNSAVNPSHSAVTALAQDGKRRAAGRAGYRGR